MNVHFDAKMVCVPTGTLPTPVLPCASVSHFRSRRLISEPVRWRRMSYYAVRDWRLDQGSHLFGEFSSASTGFSPLDFCKDSRFPPTSRWSDRSAPNGPTSNRYHRYGGDVIWDDLKYDRKLRKSLKTTGHTRGSLEHRQKTRVFWGFNFAFAFRPELILTRPFQSVYSLLFRPLTSFRAGTFERVVQFLDGFQSFIGCLHFFFILWV